MGRNPWVWFSAAVVTATVILTLGTTAAFRFDLDVDWYTGAGQWLGAAVSVLAAGTALWIATNDRKKAVADRRADRAQLEADRRADRAQVEMDRRADRAQLEADRQAERSQLEADLLREAGWCDLPICRTRVIYTSTTVSHRLLAEKSLSRSETIEWIESATSI